MIDEVAVGEALASLFRAGVWHGDILAGVAYAMSYAGKGRLEIVNVFWHLMNASPPILTEEQVDFVDDFAQSLLGNCRLEHIVRLHGDPEDPKELGRVVAAQAANWKAPG
jgi:hypothetical protein